MNRLRLIGIPAAVGGVLIFFQGLEWTGRVGDQHGVFASMWLAMGWIRAFFGLLAVLAAVLLFWQPRRHVIYGGMLLAVGVVRLFRLEPFFANWLGAGPIILYWSCYDPCIAATPMFFGPVPFFVEALEVMAGGLLVSISGVLAMIWERLKKPKAVSTQTIQTT
jgi:hypothetical protein